MIFCFGLGCFSMTEKHPIIVTMTDYDEFFFVDDANPCVSRIQSNIMQYSCICAHRARWLPCNVCILHRVFASEKQEESIKRSIKKLISTYRNTHVHQQTRAFAHTEALVSTHTHTHALTHTHAYISTAHTFMHTEKHTEKHRQWFVTMLGILMRAITKARIDLWSTKRFHHNGAFTSRRTPACVGPQEGRAC